MLSSLFRSRAESFHYAHAQPFTVASLRRKLSGELVTLGSAVMLRQSSKPMKWAAFLDDREGQAEDTQHAQDALGDVVFVDLPEVGAEFKKGDVAGVVESVKAAADVYMPLSGRVLEVNEALRDDPALANSDPMNAGWFFKIELSQPQELESLMSDTAYDDLLKSL
jgi:glycine cleavage system H protein